MNNILLRVGIQLTRQGISCHILSRSGENSLQDILENYIKQTHAKTLLQLCQIAEADKQNASMLPFQVGTFIRERSDCILELASDPEVTSITLLIAKLHSLTQSNGASIPLSTIHKAKGLEAEYIYILYPPVKLATDNKEQYEQEINLEFVAETRSKYKTIYVKQ